MRDQAIELGERVDGLVEPVQRDRVVMARFAKIRREIEAARQQSLGVFGAIEAQRHFGEHADRDHVGRRALQLSAQACFGVRNVVRVQRRGRGQQRRVMDCVAYVTEIGRRGAVTVAGRVEPIAKLAPRLRSRRIGSDEPAQRRDRVVGSAGYARGRVHASKNTPPQESRGAVSSAGAVRSNRIVRRRMERRGRHCHPVVAGMSNENV